MLGPFLLLVSACRTTPPPSADATLEPPAAPAAEASQAMASSEAILAELRLPEGALDRFEAGEARTLPVTVENPGQVPFVVLEVRFDGPIRGRRNLLVPDEAGGYRAFGAVPPGTSGRFTVGVHAPEPGEGEVRLVVRIRPLSPGVATGAMREIHLPAEGAADEVEVTKAFDTAVEAVPFTREAAEARVGLRAEDAVHVETLGAWVLRRGNDTYVVDVREAVPFPGLSLEAASLLDASQGDTVPILDAEGRLSEVPKGPLLRQILDDARFAGWTVTVEIDSGREVIRVGP